MAASSKEKWARRLEGWQLVVPSVGIALLAAGLAVPQPAFPKYLPLPTLAPAVITRARSELAEQSAQARKVQLSFEVRAIGERFRQMGRAESNGTQVSREQLERYRNQVNKTLETGGANALLSLRAIQSDLFTLALRNYERDGAVGDDFVELGGSFERVAQSQGWLRLFPRTERTVGRHAQAGTPAPPLPQSRASLSLSEDERRALFLMRWTELAGLSQAPLFRLQEPWVSLALRPRLRAPISQLTASALPAIAKLGEVRPDYPALVAKGLVLTQLGAYQEAVDCFRSYLAVNANGPYSVRARNHLIYAALRISPEP